MSQKLAKVLQKLVKICTVIEIKFVLAFVASHVASATLHITITSRMRNRK